MPQAKASAMSTPKLVPVFCTAKNHPSIGRA